MSKFPFLTSILTAAAISLSANAKAQDIKPNCELEKTIVLEFDNFHLTQICDNDNYTIATVTLPRANEIVSSAGEQLCNKYRDVLTFKARREGFVGYVTCIKTKDYEQSYTL